MKLKIVSKGRA